MENFTYNLPTRIVFGKNQIDALSRELKQENVQTMLLVYGKQSIFNLGIYDRVMETAHALGITVYEEGGVRANPELKSVLSGRQTTREKHVDFILAVGGGSVIDAAKSIAYAHFKDDEKDVWGAYRGNATIDKALPIGTILTLAATGSETNGNAVLSNDDTGEKRNIKNSILMPVFSIIDPEYTKSVPTHHVIAGSIDIMMHVFEQYFSKTPHTDTSDYMSIGVLRSVIDNTRLVLKGEDSYEARANLSWASTLALSWILQMGKIGDWASHRISYPITADYGITHGLALSIIQPAWMQIALRENPEVMRFRLSRIGRELFGIEEPEAVIEAFKDLFREFGAPARFTEAGVTIRDDDAVRMAKTAVELGNVGNTIEVDEARAVDIFNAAR